MMDGLNLISSIASGPRLEILQMLEGLKMKPSSIAKNMDTSIQALTRHLDRLSESKLIEKNSNGEYCLTPMSQVILSQIPFFEFLNNHKEYFATHDFTGIPDHLIARIGDLVNCDFEPNVMKSMQRARDFCESAKKSLQGATFTVPLEFFDTMIPNLKQGGHSKLVFGKNTVVSKGFSEYPGRKEYLKYSKSGQVKEKIVEHIPIVASVSDDDSHLIFANKDLGFPDTEGVFFSKDPKFMQWCQELIDYYWNQSEVENFTLKEM